MTTLFSLRRADFPLSLHGNACKQLLTHVVTLLNRRHAAGVVTRLVKVKSHCGEPLNEAADALASAAAEADDMVAYLHMALSLYQYDSVLAVGQARVFPGSIQCNNNVTVVSNASAASQQLSACPAPQLLPKGVAATWPPI